MAVGIASLFMNLLLLTGPFYMLQIYDRVLSSKSLPTLMALSGLVVALFVIYGLLDFARTRMMMRVSQLFDLAHVQKCFDLSLPQQPRQNAVDPLRDLRSVQQFLMSPAATNLFDVPWFPVYLLAIYLLHPMLFYLSIAGGIILVALAFLNACFSRSVEHATLKHGQAEDHLLAVCRQNSDAMHAMGMTPAVKQIWEQHHGGFLKAAQTGSDRNVPFSATSRTVRLLIQSAILGFGAYLVIQSSLSAGALIAASIIFGRAMAPLDSAIANWRGVASSLQSWGRLKQALREPAQRAPDVRLDIPRTEVIAESLTVLSPDRGTNLVEDAAFQLQSGDALAIVGPSGSGKSSLMRGLLGLLPTSEGTLRLDGATLDQWTPAERGKVIGYLPQNVGLFDGTIAENISRLRADMDSDAVLKAARTSGVHDLITSLPDGYNMRVGALNHQLSSGQIQRIGLARAIYGSPFLVLLDEPNAHLDAEGEKHLNGVIERLREDGAITIIAAHRKSALMAANKALLLIDGTVRMFDDRDTVLRCIAGSSSKSQGGLRVVGA